MALTVFDFEDVFDVLEDLEDLEDDLPIRRKEAGTARLSTFPALSDAALEREATGLMATVAAVSAAGTRSLSRLIKPPCFADLLPGAMLAFVSGTLSLFMITRRQKF